MWAWADTAWAADDAACSAGWQLPGVNMLMLGMQESTRLADTVAQSPDTLRADCRAPADFCALQYTAYIYVGDCRHDSLPRASYKKDQLGINAPLSRNTPNRAIQEAHHL